MDSLRDQIARLTTEFIQDVAELPDRTSPDDWPEAMLITAEELKRGLDWYSSEILKLIEPRGESELREALEQAVELLDDSARIPAKDHAHHERVKALGKEIGFGALMSVATLAWRECSEEQGHPVGSEFTSGHCRIVVEKAVARARQALATPSAPVSGLVAEIDALFRGVGFTEPLSVEYSTIRSMDDEKLYAFLRHGDEENGDYVCVDEDPDGDEIPSPRLEFIAKLVNAWPRLKSALASRDEWRPMTEVPKDGSLIWLTCGKTVRKAFWKMDVHGEWGWRDDVSFIYFREREPAGWMPYVIPTPPTSQERKS